ncbi:MAG: hypothetical protein NPINA01_29180 [Nitrospinaceae bacterium]|nr:MAG: hypothetical protein NPINA01_29180 [Nitrospinaceae bacterium]
MAKNRNREEAVNTQLAILISKLGVTADAETIQVHGKHRPDVLFQMRGLRVVIEGKFADHPNADEVVLDDARNRVRNGIAHIAAAAVYPLELRTTSTSKIEEVLQSAQLKYRIVSEVGESEDWYEGTPASLMDALRRAQEALTEDDLVEKMAKSLSIQLVGVAKLWMGQEGACDRLSNLLGIYPTKDEKPAKSDERRETSAKVSALVLANAFIFQEQLAHTDRRISSLNKLDKEKDIVSATNEHWRWIWENINYVPIFQLGGRVLDELPLSSNTLQAVRSLLEKSKTICAQQSALRHDLMGRIYHWLLHHAKFLGTYYTSVSSATLLLKLALAKPWNRDFGDPVELASFKVGDLACGTGTLLMATAQALSDKYIKLRAETNRSLSPVDLRTLHRTLMENVLYGYDVLPSAVHLTASTLAILAPEVAFVRMNLYVMPMGLDHSVPRLGSLEFLTTNEVQTQVALDYSAVESVRTGASSSVATNAKVPKLNLCVMNPPFVRSVGGNLLFGSLPDERGSLQSELKKQVKKIGASATAGLGSVFVALGDRHLEKGGRLAFVLPAALVSGEAWGATRKLIANSYHLETVIASHDAERPNFSENTDLSEILFIARKREGKEEAERTTYINLWRNPHTIHEALDLANRIEHTTEPVSVEDLGLTTIRSSATKLGEMVTMPPAKTEENWTGALFAQTQLLRSFWNLQNGRLVVPGCQESEALSICKLGDLGELGYDRRDIHDAFEISTDTWSSYPAFWGHEANKVYCLGQSANAHLLERTKPAKGRKTIKKANSVWSKAGRILIAERLWPVTHRVIAIRFDTEVLGNTWWALKGQSLNEQHEKALILWLNSSPSLLMYFGRRVITRSAWMQMKKPAWTSMPVLDVRALDSENLNALAAVYDDLAEESLEAIARLDQDQTRKRIDDAISETLGLPDLSPIRELLAREPGLTAQKIS